MPPKKRGSLKGRSTRLSTARSLRSARSPVGNREHSAEESNCFDRTQRQIVDMNVSPNLIENLTFDNDLNLIRREGTTFCPAVVSTAKKTKKNATKTVRKPKATKNAQQIAKSLLDQINQNKSEENVMNQIAIDNATKFELITAQMAQLQIALNDLNKDKNEQVKSNTRIEEKSKVNEDFHAQRNRKFAYSENAKEYNS